jgi:pyruvate/2-oxoglutarate/acetoin dehydrogenase E1 component
MSRLALLPNTIFLGQQVASETFYGTLKDIPMEKRWEMPVAEDLQMGLSIGLALEGYLPISIYQRMDFLPRAMDQLVNHLNLLPEMSRGLYKPKIIIRTTIGSKSPMDAGPQHSQDLTAMLSVLKFPVMTVTTPEEVHIAYSMATLTGGPVLIIELQDLYRGSKNVHTSLKKLIEEIKKCDLVCANCHRIRTNK